MKFKILVSAVGIVLFGTLLFAYWTRTSTDTTDKQVLTFTLESMKLPAGATVIERSAMGTSIETLVFTSENLLEDNLDLLESQLDSFGFVKEDRSEFGALYVKDGVTELAIFPELDKPKEVVLMLLRLTPEEAKEAAKSRRISKENEVRFGLRSLVRETALAQHEFSKKMGRFGTLAELCETQAGYTARLPKEFESGKLPDGTVITITLSPGSFKAKAVRGEFSCWIDETGSMEQSP